MFWLAQKRRWYLNKCTHPDIKRNLSSDWPSPACNWKQTPWLAIDLETTSLDPRKGEIISLGWVAIDEGKIPLTSIQRWLVKPKDSVGESATIHYLRDEDLQQGTALRQALIALTNAMAGRVCIFHNKQLDIAFLKKAMRAHFDISWFWPAIDTLKLELKRMERKGHTPQNNELRLGECRRRYSLPDYPLHDASHDALACAELFIAWANHSGKNGPSLKDCLNWSR